MIRQGVGSDIAALVDLAKKMHAESPRYKGIEFIPEHMVLFLEQVIDSDRHLVLVSENGQGLHGMFGGALNPFMFNFDEFYSADFGFYIRPEYRGRGDFIKMIRGYEAWALGMGVKPENICLGESTGIMSQEVCAMLDKLGYTLSGQSFSKRSM